MYAFWTMNLTFFHLTLVHIPILLVPLGLIFLLLAIYRSNKTLKATGLVFFILSAIFVVPAFRLGEDAEESVKNIVAVDKHNIEEHEEAADFALWLTLTLGLLAVGQISLEKFKPESARVLTLPLVILGLVSATTLSFTAWQGGKIRHPEAHYNE